MDAWHPEYACLEEYKLLHNRGIFLLKYAAAIN